MAKNPAVLRRRESAPATCTVHGAMIDATAVSCVDKQKLTAQSQHSSNNDDGALCDKDK